MHHLNEPSGVIRRYAEHDLPQVLDIWEAAAREVYTFFPGEFWQAERCRVATLYLPASETWVCEADMRLVGFVSLLGNEVGGLFVQPKFQRRGVGRALLEIVQQLRPMLEVDVFTENPLAIKFYKRHGFFEICEYLHPEFQRELFRLRWAR